MTEIAVKISYSGAIPGTSGWTQREWNDVRRGAWEAVAKHWSERFRPKHFTVAGAKEYGYLPRSGEASGIGSKAYWRSYTGRKKRKLGHTRPLVYSGELEALSRQYRADIVVSTNRSRCRVVLTAANKANWRNPHSQINMRDELTRVSPAEAAELIRVFDRHVEAVLAGVTGYQTKKAA